MIEIAIDDNSFHQKPVPLDAEYVRNLEQENITLRHEISNLKRLIFGSKSESFIPQNTPSTQLSLDIQAETIASCSVIKSQKIEYTRNQLEIKKDHRDAPNFPNIWNAVKLL